MMGNRNTPIIMRDDLDLFARIAKHGFVDMEYIYRFTYKGRKKRTIDDRIRQLNNHQYLMINKTFIPPDYTVNYRTGYRIIALGKRGLEIVRDAGMDAEDRSRALLSGSPYRMYHQVQIATVCDLLLMSYANTEKSNWELIRVLNEKETYLEEASNQPDAMMIFRQRQKEDSAVVLVFLEIERSYASEASLKRKLLGYRMSIEERLYPQMLQQRVIDQRILFVAQTDGQKSALKDKLQGADTERLHILLVGYQEIAKAPLDAVYETGSGSRIKLLGDMRSNENGRNAYAD